MLATTAANAFAALLALLTGLLSLLSSLLSPIRGIPAFIKGHVPAAMIPGFRNPVPFRTFVRHNWLNIATQIACLGLAMAIYTFLPPLSPPLFAVYDGVMMSACGQAFAQPLRKEYINTAVMSILSYAGPAIIMGGVGGLWVLRDFNDSNVALMGLGYALSTSTLVVDIIKVTVGGLRPHFWVVCDPILIAHAPGSPVSPPIYATADLVCANEDPCALKEAMMSFPSGHSCAAFAGFGFLGLWLFGHIKHTAGPVAHWKIVVWVAPWVVAGLLAWSKVLDGWHHPGDVVAGALLGASFAAIAYKAVYGSILDPATNHVAR